MRWLIRVPLPETVMHSTNKMLEHLRASGFAHGRGIRSPVDRYREIAGALKRMACLRATELRIPPLREARLHFEAVGVRWDPDAWYLPAKHLLDGLVQAGVFRNDHQGARIYTAGACTWELPAGWESVHRRGFEVEIEGEPVEVRS